MFLFACLSLGSCIPVGVRLQGRIQEFWVQLILIAQMSEGDESQASRLFFVCQEISTEEIGLTLIL